MRKVYSRKAYLATYSNVQQLVRKCACKLVYNRQAASYSPSAWCLHKSLYMQEFKQLIT